MWLCAPGLDFETLETTDSTVHSVRNLGREDTAIRTNPLTC